MSRPPNPKLLVQKRVEQMPSVAKLLTRAQVIEQLKVKIAKSRLSVVAAEHELSPQQLSDIIYGRANLSTKAINKLSYKLWEFYEKI